MDLKMMNGFEYTVRFKHEGQSLMLIVQAKTVAEVMQKIRDRFSGSEIYEISVDVAGKQQSQKKVAGIESFL
jgi:hypothetical protein